MAWLTVALGLAAGSASAAPAPVSTEPLPAGAELQVLDDAGRVTVSAREDNRHRIMRRAVDGRWTTLVDLAGPAGVSVGGDAVVAGNASGQLVVAWISKSDRTDFGCAPLCAEAIHVARSEGDGPLREIARLPPPGEGPPTVSELGLSEVGAGGEVDLGYGNVRGRVRASVVGDAVSTRPALQDEPFLQRIADDGTRYAVALRFDGARPFTELTRQAPGGLPVPVPLGMDIGLGRFDIEPLPGGRLLVFGFAGAVDPSLVTAVVDASGRVVSRVAHPGVTGPARRASPVPGGGRVLSVRRGAAEELVLVSPTGEVGLQSWPGGAPAEGIAGADRSGAVLLAELRPRPGGVADQRVFRLRRLSPYGGEDPVVEVPAGTLRFGPYDFDALRTAAQGAVAAVPPAPAGGTPTLLWRGPDVAPPTVRARAAGVRGVPREVVVRVRCDEGCQVRGGRLRAGNPTAQALSGARVASPAAARLRAGRTAAVRLRVPAAERRAVARAHRRGRSRRVVLRPVIRDPLGNARRIRIGVRVRP